MNEGVHRERFVVGSSHTRLVSIPTIERRGAHPKVAVGIRDLRFHQEVLDWIERDARLDVVGAVSDPESLVRLRAQHAVDVSVACPQIAHELRHPATRQDTSILLLVAQEMTVPLLRDAIDLGSQGVFAWPEERVELTNTIVETAAPRIEDRTERGRVIAVMGARGGVGTTFLAANLAGAFSTRGLRCVLVDLDADFADLTVALGVPSEQFRTIGDLVPVMTELTPEHLDDVLFQHRSGFRALLAPESLDEGSRPPLGLYAAAIALLAGSADVVVVHVPRSLDEVAKGAVELADEVLLVATQDSVALFGARRMLASLPFGDTTHRCRVVINRVARGQITVGDVERALGVTPFAGVRFDPAVKRVQERGDVLGARARGAGKDIRALARQLVSAAAEAVDGGR